MEAVILFSAILFCLVCFTLRAGLVPVRFLVLIVIAEPIANFLKRAIFLMGPQNETAYHAAQVIPAACVALGFVLVVMRRVRYSRTAMWLGLFTACAGITTLIGDGSWSAKAAAAVDYILPALAFPIAFLVPMEEIGKLAKWYLGVLAIAVPYALLQFFGGPTLVERVWASATADISIEASKTFSAMNGVERFRPFSFYPDPFTFGIFITAAFGIIAAAGAMGALHRRLAQAGCALCLLAAVLTLSRSPVLGVIIIPAIFAMLCYKIFQRPKTLFLIYAVAFVVASQFSGYLVENYAASQSGVDGEIASRFETVGTLTDRSHSLELLPELFSRENVPGRGYAYSAATVERGFEGADLSPLMNSHNVVIGVMLATGPLGLILLAMFLGRLIKEGLLLSAAQSKQARASRWLAASVIAHLVVGLFSGNAVLSAHFFIIAGILARGGFHVTRVQRQPIESRHTVREFRQLVVGS